MLGRSFSYKEFIIYTLGEDRGYQFALWAFGEGFESLFLDELYKRWNASHGEDFILHPNGNVEKDLIRMIELWEKQKGLS